MVKVVDNEVGEAELLGTRSLLETSLHDTAAMFMHTDRNTLADASIKDEISILTRLLRASDVCKLRLVSCLELDKESLDNVVTMHVHDEINDGFIKVGNDSQENNMVAVVLVAELEAVNIFKRNIITNKGWRMRI